jgi:hypothetical protein
MLDPSKNLDSWYLTTNGSTHADPKISNVHLVQLGTNKLHGGRISLPAHISTYGAPKRPIKCMCHLNIVYSGETTILLPDHTVSYPV